MAKSRNSNQDPLKSDIVKFGVIFIIVGAIIIAFIAGGMLK